MIPSDWRWYRRARRGCWAQVTGYLWGRRWFRIIGIVGDGSQHHMHCEEHNP